MQSDIIADRYRQILNEQMTGSPSGMGRKGSHCVKQKGGPSGKKRCAKYSGGVAVGGAKKSKGSKKQKTAAKRNPWVLYVKEYADAHGMTYSEALKDPRTSASYHKL